MMKKLRFLLIFVILAAVLTVSAPAATYFGDCGAQGDNVKWSLDTETGVLNITGTGKMKDYSYSSSAPWYSYRSYIKTVNIASGVTSIGDWAFFCCRSLKSITIPDSVTSIGRDAFDDCSSLESVSIGNSVTSIGDDAFCDCSSLESITIPDSVTSIGKWAFRFCSSLTSITIPDSVTSIGYEAFYDTAFYNNSSNWENNVLYIGKHLIKAKDSISGSYETKPGTLTIEDSAFHNCSSLTSITIPDSVTSIGDDAFYYCSSLESINIPDSVTSIGNGAFEGCTSLTSITIGNGVTSIGVSAFAGTAYYKNSSNWENNVLYIGKHLVKAKDSISGSYKIKPGTLTIAGSAFDDCTSLTSIIIPDSVTSIGYWAFECCYSLESITIPDSVTSIGGYAFRSCSSLTSITIPDSVTSIGEDAFEYCSSLKSVSIGNGVTSIGEDAFAYCSSLKAVYKPVSASWSYSFPSGVSVIYTCKVTFEGDYTGIQYVEKNSNVQLPTPPEGYTYSYTKNGLSWDISAPITSDITINVTKTIKKYTVTFTGAYTGTQTVEHGKTVTASIPPEGYTYSYTKNGSAWNITAPITSDITLYVKQLCDVAEIADIFISETERFDSVDIDAQNLVIRCATYKSKYSFPGFLATAGASFGIYTDEYLKTTAKNGTAYNRGENIFYIKATAESGKVYKYKLIITRLIPESLGILAIKEQRYNTITFNLYDTAGSVAAISGDPLLILSYGSAQNSMNNEAFVSYDPVGLTVFAAALPPNSQYYFKLSAIYDGIIVESTPIRGKTGDAPPSSECDVLWMNQPAGGFINEQTQTISNLRVTNEYESIEIDAEVSPGATWRLLDASNAEIADKTLSLKAGKETTAFIKVTAQDEYTTKTYSISVYRQTKSDIPLIQISGNLVTVIPPDNCEKIIYTLNKSEPYEQNPNVKTYEEPFTITAGTEVKVAAKQLDKDEYSDVVSSKNAGTIYTVAFTGAYTGTLFAEKGKTVTAPIPPEGYVYSYTHNGLSWDFSTPITSDITIIVRKKPAGVEEIAASVDGTSYTVSVKANIGITADIYLALYTESGKMLTVKKVGTLQNEMQTTVFGSLDNPGGFAFYKVILLDKNNCPVCKNFS